MQAFTLRSFTNGDWDAFAGAEKLPGGAEPMYGEAGDWCVIISGNIDHGLVTVELMHMDDVNVDAYGAFFRNVPDAVRAATEALWLGVDSFLQSPNGEKFSAN
jgi:hypothetical protein